MKVEFAESDAEILSCFPIMRHLRNLESAPQFLRQVRAQQVSGYRLAFVTEGGEPLAVAGFRLGENLAWGRHLYVDDLVALPAARSKGGGATLLTWLSQLAESEGAQELHLDSGTDRTDAHRFYEREGLRVSSYHFKRTI
jgi:GNAT superfamily N-acetyltransferase